MSDAIAVMKRYELKYLLTAEQCAAIKAGLTGRMQLDAYGATRIDSLYFDTPDRALIARSLEKPVYKEKLRLRSYGTPGVSGATFLEIKKKSGGIIYKIFLRQTPCGYK